MSRQMQVTIFHDPADSRPAFGRLQRGQEVMNDSSPRSEARQTFRTWEADVMFWQSAGQLQMRCSSHFNQHNFSWMAALEIMADEAPARSG